MLPRGVPSSPKHFLHRKYADPFAYRYQISPIVALKPFVAKYQRLNPITQDYTFTVDNQDLLFSVPLVESIFGAISAPF